MGGCIWNIASALVPSWDSLWNLSFSLRFEFFSEMFDHSVCETRDPSLTIWIINKCYQHTQNCPVFIYSLPLISLIYTHVLLLLRSPEKDCNICDARGDTLNCLRPTIIHHPDESRHSLSVLTLSFKEGFRKEVVHFITLYSDPLNSWWLAADFQVSCCLYIFQPLDTILCR